ncbi:hypothetical protein PF70_02615 [Pseudomonas asplenii]|nr:hypothetical protein PF70_02615 [Pseudomonas fuscovaginae]
MGRVAQHRQVRTDLFLGLHQGQRVQVSSADLLQGAEAITEHTLQLAEEAALVQLREPLSVHPEPGPDQCTTVVRQRQQGHRPFVGEPLEGHAVMGFAR